MSASQEFPASEIGARIQQVREREKLSQQALADQLQVHLRTYQNYERGDRHVSMDVVLALYELFGDDPTWLLTGRSTPPSERSHLKSFIDEGVFDQITKILQSPAHGKPTLPNETLPSLSAQIYNAVIMIPDANARQLAIEKFLKILNSRMLQDPLKAIERDSQGLGHP